MIKKNTVLTLTVDSVTGDGQGVAHFEGMAVFIPYASVGDVAEVVIIKVAKKFSIGKILKIVEPSCVRTEIDCDAFLKCGGCSFRHVSVEEEERIKTQSVADLMKHIGGFAVDVEKIKPTPQLHYRNKVQLPVCEDEKGLRCGFFAPYSHRIVENTIDCLCTPKIFSKIAHAVIDFLKKERISGYNESTGCGLVRHLYMRINKFEQVMLCIVINGKEILNAETEKKFTEFITEKFPSIVSVFVNENTLDTNSILTEKFRLLKGAEFFEDELLNVRLRLSPDSFFQINREGAETVYKTAFSLVKGYDFENVYDLYCGVGSIGLTMFSEIKRGNLDCRAKNLFGIEIVEKAAALASENAERNGIENAHFRAADSSDITEMDWFDKFPPSLVILDPPRKGTTEKLLKYLSLKNVKNILYISCNPATLARDMAFLYKEEYRCEKIFPINLFPRTGHVECVCMLTRE